MRPRALPRHAVIVGSVLLFHAAALWLLQSGLLRRVVEVVVPVQLLSEIMAPVVPPSAAVPPPPPKPRAEPPRPSAVAPRPAPLPPAPQPLALAADATPPSPNAHTGVLTPPPLAAATAPVSPSPVPSQVKPVKVELPSSDADYLNNPKPAYPMLSKRMGEQGQVLVRVLIGADGLPQKADIKTSSGFDRLDQAALATVLKWRYVPGKRAGTAEAMWFNVPLNFVLE